MLQTKHLTKIYKPKKGVPVKALDDVTLTFPEKGMVFLLGKSGSGKSTLLNLLGGLDRATSGEILLQGNGTEDFKQSDFDSYRNTLVGFIFQEYNVLEEFTVGANVALALELQGKKADDETVSRILSEVDLEGFGTRRPNELSGGQKQRVAIARALVKDPRIIMADEPTGALDSVTGRQVLDTLKKLSREKLVLVVSHDREFAEKYGDRIVELKDGKVLSDRVPDPSAQEEANGLSFDGEVITVPAGYHITEEDRAAINAYLDAAGTGGALSLSSLKKQTFLPTPPLPDEEKKPLSLIRSRLPMKNAFPIGAGALKHKKIRLFFTVLLSCVAFGLFGLSDTFASYDHVRANVDSILDTGIRYVSLSKSVWVEEENDGYYRYRMMTGEDVNKLNGSVGLKLTGVYEGREDYSFIGQYDTSREFTKSDFHIYSTNFTGFAEVNEETLSAMDARLVAGKLPDGAKNEILISTYVCRTFLIGGYRAERGEDFQKISAPEDMVGKTIDLAGRRYTVSGVVETGMYFDRYLPLTEEKKDPSAAQRLVDYALYQELAAIRMYSWDQVAMVGEGFLDRLLSEKSDVREIGEDFYACFLYPPASEQANYWGVQYFKAADEKTLSSVTFLSEGKTSLSADEIILPEDAAWIFFSDSPGTPSTDPVPEGMTVELFINRYAGEENRLGVYRVAGFTTEHDCVILPTLPEGDFFADPAAVYTHAVGAMPEDRSAVTDLVEFCYSGEDVRYELQNPASFELETVHGTLREFAKVFFWIGVSFAVFASLMLANFISQSISYRRQEIGILRAIGARGADVFRIFFSESFVIAMINFVLSASGVGLAVFLINYLIRERGRVLVTVLHFGVRQVLLLFLVSVLAAAVASFIPVYRHASKKPIDAIRGR